MAKSKKVSKKAPSPKKKVTSHRKKEDTNLRSPNRTAISSEKSIHLFDNATILELADALTLNKAFTDRIEIQFAIRLHKILAGNKPNDAIAGEILVEHRAKAFRVTELGRKPLDDRYTLGAGGRVNIGMAQLVSGISDLKAKGGLYCSLERETAIAEYESAGPIGPKTCIYELTCKKKTIALVDMDTVVSSIDRLIPEISLTAKISSIPYLAEWRFQKHPLASQLVGDWLARHFPKVDGIAFGSTKRRNGVNLFIFDPGLWKASLAAF